VVNSFKDIGISSSDLSAVDQVEKLQENEDVEQVGEHSFLRVACPEIGAILGVGLVKSCTSSLLGS
jgi:hypothetical protein